MDTMDLSTDARQRIPTMASLRAHRRQIMDIAARRGVSNIRVFGSVARGDAAPDSDVDLLVDFHLDKSGLDLIAFGQDVEQLIGHRVDVGTEVHHSIRARVEMQAIPL